MRAYEFIPDFELDEDLKSLKNKATSAIAAGSMMATGTLGPVASLASHSQQVSTAEPEAPKKEEPKAKKTDLDRTVLALTMWAEARNQGLKGMRAVGHVIKNRADADKPKLFGSGIRGVAFKNKQFSCWNDNDPNRNAASEVKDLDPATPDGKAWHAAYQLAGNILTGKDSDITQGATFYHTTAVNPSWASSLEPTAQIADHIFYKQEHA